MTNQTAYSAPALINWLGKISAQVNAFEEKGRKNVSAGEQEKYIEIMREKAQLLSSLEEAANPYLANIDDNEVLNYAKQELGAFSRNARKALEIGSVFFMSALLFPDDHQPDEPNNLELFIDKLNKLLQL